MAKFIRKGITKIFFVEGEEVFDDMTAPDLSAELDTAVELTCDIAEISGFSYQNNPVEVPDMCTTFTPKIPGEDTADDSEMTFYEDDTANNVWDTLVKGTHGYILFFSTGAGDETDPIIAGDECEIWPVSVAKQTREFTVANDPARYMISFTVTSRPEQNAVVVA